MSNSLIKLIFFLFAWQSLIACSGNSPTPTTQAPSATDGQYAVAMPDQFSADVAMEILADGGNAVDAAVAAQFVLAVTLPEAGNIGGGGFMTIYMDGQSDFIDYREKAPAAAHRDMYLDENGDVKQLESLFGAKASGVPGTVAGMFVAHEKYGSLPWERVVQPAVTLAREGFHVPEKLANYINYYIERTEKRGIKSNFAKYFAAAGEPNVLFKQPELADTLYRIRNMGPAGFYVGKTAELVADFMAKNGGLITEQDMASYRAQSREPIHFSWQGYDVLTAPPPSSGGVAVAQWLGMLEQVIDDQALPEPDSSRYLHLVAEAGKRVFADRAEYLGDPDFYPVPVAELIDLSYIAYRAEGIQPNAISTTEEIRPGLPESEETTHFSIVDANGNAVSNTTTLNLGFGSGVVVDGAGFLLNDEMDDFSAKPGVPNFFGALGGEANAIEPHKRMLSSMTPTIVLKDGQVQLVTGSPGGTTIISSVVQTVMNTMLFDMDAEQAANSPRFHHQLWPKDTIRMHPGFAPEVIAELESMGYTIDQRRFGDVQLILRKNNQWQPASERSGRGKSAVATLTK